MRNASPTEVGLPIFKRCEMANGIFSASIKSGRIAGESGKNCFNLPAREHKEGLPVRRPLLSDAVIEHTQYLLEKDSPYCCRP